MPNKYVVNTTVKGYYTSVDAKNQSNPRGTVKPGTYYVFNEKYGMINVTSKSEVPGSWINPSDNIVPDNKVTETKPANPSSNKNTTVSNDTSNSYKSQSTISQADDSTNKRVYSPTKEYIPIYIINLLNNGKIEFNCEPDEFSESNTSQFDAQDIRGRSSPYQGYNSSGPRTLNYSLTIHDDLCKYGIVNTVNRLRSLVYPEYSGVLRPPNCIIRIGDMVHMKAIVNDVNVNWQKPYRDGVYLTAEVSISLTEVVDKAYSASEIWSKGGYV